MHVLPMQQSAKLTRTFHAATNNLMVGLLKAAWDDLIDMLSSMADHGMAICHQIQEEMSDWMSGQTEALKKRLGLS